jgi:hypothetical protein
MSNRLLRRQVKLLEYLTSVDAIFEDRGLPPAANGLEGLDLGRLGLEARFSFEKRLEKISSVFPRTFASCASGWGPVLENFVKACPPADIGRFENAQQFFEFLSQHKVGDLEPPWLLDVAACELACARARRHRDVPESRPRPNHAPTPAVRRAPGVAILRCAYNVRAIFENASGGGAAVRRETLVAIFGPSETERLEIFEVGRPVFDLLSACAEWTDHATLAAASAHETLIENLAERGLLELRP